MKVERSSHDRTESGFALILAIMSLMLLTFLGLTLAATTSTELQIAANYRWSQQAYYNAEAGLAVARAYLSMASVQPNLPNARTWTQPMADPVPPPAPFPVPLTTIVPIRADEWGNAPRNMEPKANATDPASLCDEFGAGAGYGVVLDDGDPTDAGSPPSPTELPLQNKTVAFGIPLRGAFTVWVRRALQYGTVPGDPEIIRDDPTGNLVIVTVEGVAPATGAAFGDTSVGGRRYYANRAVRLLEATVSLAAAGNACKGTMAQASETGFHCLELEAPPAP